MSLILLILFGVFLILSILNSQRTMLAFFEKEAHSFLRLISLSQENSIFAEAKLEDKITDNLLNIISYLNEYGYNQENLDKIKEHFDINSIVIYDPINQRLISKSGNPYELNYQTFLTDEKIKYDYFSVLNEKFIRFIYKTDKKIFQIELSAEEIRRFSQEYGIGKILNQMADNPLVQYIALQDLQGIIFATPNIKMMPKIQSDAFLLSAFNNGVEMSRITKFGNKKVLEIVQPFVVENKMIGLFRIGMNLDNYYQHLRSSYIQMTLIFIILLVSGISIFTIFIKSQDYKIREYFFTYLLGTIDEGVLLVDNKGIIKGVNKMFNKISEMSAPLLLNKRYSERFDDDPFLIKVVHETGNPVEEEKRIFKKIVQYATYPLFDPNKKFMGTISILHDVTKLREQETEQKEKERLSFLGNLVANFAHEIKNPLNGIAIAVQRLQREFPVQDMQSKQLISVIIKEIDSMTRILNDFLSLARPQIKEEREFNLSQLIKDLGIFIKEQTDQKKIKYNEMIEENLYIKGNMEDIKRALMNLLLNAIEAVSSQVEPAPEIGISLNKRKKNIVVQIMDNGPGIPRSVLKKIFEPYFTTKKSGTGLGLFIAQKIVKEQNGMIKVHSIQGRGTTFEVILPILND